ncbi:MAG: hypothetical protein J7K21_00370 [Desulfurococcales archaeon]|nr:hypothetical protein [Desulfurococcales archaeon]
MVKSREYLEELLTLLNRIDQKLNDFLPIFTNKKKIIKTKNLVRKAISYTRSSIKELRNDKYELAKALVDKARNTMSLLNKIDQDSASDVVDSIERLSSYIVASYYDFSGKINIIKKAYRRYILAFALALILSPLFIGASILLIGFLIFPLLISIHAFRARRKLGAIIASILLPLTMFIDILALNYMVYSFLNPEEIYSAANQLGIGVESMYVIVLLIGIIAGISFILAIRSFIALYRNIDALL